jgi:hypothetical protein
MKRASSATRASLVAVRESALGTELPIDDVRATIAIGTWAHALQDAESSPHERDQDRRKISLSLSASQSDAACGGGGSARRWTTTRRVTSPRRKASRNAG